jgi:hypothetical protein
MEDLMSSTNLMSSTKLVSAILSLVFISSVTTAYSASPAVMVPGKWEVTIHTLEPIEAPPMTFVTCIDAANAAKGDIPKSKAHDDCVVSGGGLSGSVLAYTVTCAHRPRKTNVKVTYAGTTYSGTIVIEEGDLVIKQTIEGKRLGDCDPAE